MMVVCGGCSTPMNELPMYGGMEKTPMEIEADNWFIEAVTKDQTREEASRETSEFGWQYYYKGDLKTAMKRFNQAWMLDPDNPHAYWGFGVLLGERSGKWGAFRKIDQAIEMLEKADRLSPQNAGILEDLAYSYTRKGFSEKEFYNRDGQEFFDKADTLYSRVRQIEPRHKLLYYNWAACLHYQGKNKEALSIIEEGKRFDIEVPQDFIKEIKRGMR